MLTIFCQRVQGVSILQEICGARRKTLRVYCTRFAPPLHAMRREAFFALSPFRCVEVGVTYDYENHTAHSLEVVIANQIPALVEKHQLPRNTEYYGQNPHN